MKAIIAVLAVSCCILAISAVANAEATIGDLDQLATVAGPVAPEPLDPYVGQGDLITKAVPVAGCYLWHANCAEAPPGVQCNPNNPYCKCNGSHLCVNMPPG